MGRIQNLGPVTTYGVNDTVLDSWGQIETWVAGVEIFGCNGSPSTRLMKIARETRRLDPLIRAL